ncbi:MAG TPA: filamentous hemagglutinin N-terminal domain-containing protein [Burkholderiaceae bacterium]|nr:filamentous hemagglutinin N-terminal domain-containing protein [Burkholderiaceae bacterium]
MNIHTRRNGGHTTYPLLVLALAGVPILPALANPQGGQVVAGQATINGGPGLTTVNQQSSRAIINWQSFSIQPGETTRFVQPSANAAVLNRVVTGNPSQLMGTLQSNGQVFLINPNGVLVGKDGIIQTNGFVASTLDVNNNQFMQGGPLEFLGTSSAAVSNLGTIRAESGDVHLLAQQVDNAGSIAAPNGVASLAGGTRILLAPANAERIVVQPDAGSIGGSVVNDGTLAAAQVELKAAGGNPYALAVNAGGSISAIRVEEVGGRVLIGAPQGAVQVSGTVTAQDGDRGGTVQITGQQVGLSSTASIDASGTTGGGTVLIGGDYQGKNPAVQNAQSTTIVAGATIKADATDIGDGGKVVVWADGHTGFAGAVSARGGANGGNGGLAEVSGKQTLAYTGTVDLRAPQGSTGDLLLDPIDIYITDDPPTGSIAVGGLVSAITVTDLANALDTANVTISTAAPLVGGEGNITLSATAVFNSANSLTLDADRDITLNANLINLGSGSVTLRTQRGDIDIKGHPIEPVLTAKNLTLISEAGSIYFAKGMAICSDLPRFFAWSPRDIRTSGAIEFSSWTNSTPLTMNVHYGLSERDAGASGPGYYYRTSSPTPTPLPGSVSLNQAVVTIAPPAQPITPINSLGNSQGLSPQQIEAARNSNDAKLVQLVANLELLQDWVKKSGPDKDTLESIALIEREISERLFARWAKSLADDIYKTQLAVKGIPGLDAFARAYVTSVLEFTTRADNPAVAIYVHQPGKGNVKVTVEEHRSWYLNQMLDDLNTIIAQQERSLNALIQSKKDNESSAQKPGPNMGGLFDYRLSAQEALQQMERDIANTAKGIEVLTSLRASIESAQQEFTSSIFDISLAGQS